MLSKQPLPLADFIGNLHSFDIVLMHGIFPSSVMLEEVQGSPYSHVGVVLIAQDLMNAGLPIPGVEPQARLFWESNVVTDLNTTPLIGQVDDVLLKAGKNGPQLTDLTNRITFNYQNQYDSIFAGRKLRFTPTPEMFTTMVALIQQVHGDLFPMGPDGSYLDGQNFMLGRFQQQPVLNGTFFCSQLTARTFMNLNLLTQQYVDNSYSPADFSETPDVSLLQDAWFGKEIMLDTSTIPVVKTN